jgi:hypothetical protein
MLVCTECGTVIARSGQACPACGHRGTIDSRFYPGEVRQPPAGAPPPAPDPDAAAGLGSVLVDRERAWSPWLATLFAIALGPAAGVVVAAHNLRRFQLRAGDPWVSTWWVLVLQLLAAVVAGLIARNDPGAAWLVLALATLVIAVVLTRWQWEPVLQQRRTHPGNHSPGPDAFGVVLLAVAIGLLAGWLTLFLGDRLSGGAFRQALGAALSPVNG